MFCPKCSHEQSLEEMRFCSRCGFPLGGVALLVNNEGDLAKVASTTTSRSQRGQILRSSLLFTVIAWTLALLSTLFWDQGGPAESVARVACLVFALLGLVALIRFTYTYLFTKCGPEVPADRKGLQSSERHALPPQQSTPARDFTKRVDTAQMRPRYSVTENTTRLLEDEPRERGE